MKGLFLIYFSCVFLLGCSGIDAPNRPIAPSSEYGKYTFVAEIPVIRPSTRNTAELKTTVMALVKKHKVGNSMAYLMGNVPTYDDRPITDAEWVRRFKALGRWEDKGWNYDSGTTAQVYLKWADSVSHTYGGQVVFVKDGKELGFRSIAGGRNLFGYYKDMAKLGIYIP